MEPLALRGAPAGPEPVARSRRERDLELQARRAWLRNLEGEART